jgi:hypothetical protein
VLCGRRGGGRPVELWPRWRRGRPRIETRRVDLVLPLQHIAFALAAIFAVAGTVPA